LEPTTTLAPLAGWKTTRLPLALLEVSLLSV